MYVVFDALHEGVVLTGGIAQDKPPLDEDINRHQGKQNDRYHDETAFERKRPQVERRHGGLGFEGRSLHGFHHVGLSQKR